MVISLNLYQCVGKKCEWLIFNVVLPQFNIGL